MVCAIPVTSLEQPLAGEAESPTALNSSPSYLGVEVGAGEFSIPTDLSCETPDDPFDDFEEDDFDDDFDDDFEEDWEDDLTEDDEFPDTFGGEEVETEPEGEEEESPFSDDPDFDD
jgi:hypothetical protein